MTIVILCLITISFDNDIQMYYYLSLYYYNYMYFISNLLWTIYDDLFQINFIKLLELLGTKIISQLIFHPEKIRMKC